MDKLPCPVARPSLPYNATALSLEERLDNHLVEPDQIAAGSPCPYVQNEGTSGGQAYQHQLAMSS